MCLEGRCFYATLFTFIVQLNGTNPNTNPVASGKVNFLINKRQLFEPTIAFSVFYNNIDKQNHITTCIYKITLQYGTI